MVNVSEPAKVTAGTELNHALPFDVKTLPEVLGTTACATSRLVLAAEAELAPVPPLAIGTALTKPSAASNRPADVRLLAS